MGGSQSIEDKGPIQYCETEPAQTEDVKKIAAIVGVTMAATGGAIYLYHKMRHGKDKTAELTSKPKKKRPTQQIAAPTGGRIPNPMGMSTSQHQQYRGSMIETPRGSLLQGQTRVQQRPQTSMRDSPPDEAKSVKSRITVQSRNTIQSYNYRSQQPPGQDVRRQGQRNSMGQSVRSSQYSQQNQQQNPPSRQSMNHYQQLHSRQHTHVDSIDYTQDVGELDFERDLEEIRSVKASVEASGRPGFGLKDKGDRYTLQDYNPKLLDQDEELKEQLSEIRVRLDGRVLAYETIVQIFDKRQIVGGVKQLKLEFKNKRRSALQDGRHEQYKKTVLQTIV